MTLYTYIMKDSFDGTNCPSELSMYGHFCIVWPRTQCVFKVFWFFGVLAFFTSNR